MARNGFKIRASEDGGLCLDAVYGKIPNYGVRDLKVREAMSCGNVADTVGNYHARSAKKDGKWFV
jgi:hypothetical protein